MGFTNFFRRSPDPAPTPVPDQSVSPAVESVSEPRIQASMQGDSPGVKFSGLDDPALLEFIRSGDPALGKYVHGMKALRNMAVLRCVSLISESIGMLPLSLIRRDETKAPAKDHPAYRLLRTRPNGWQTPYEFKSQMQLSALINGNAYARVVWSRGRPIALVPLDFEAIEPKLTDDWRMQYRYTRKDGNQVVLQAHEVFHLRDLSPDGINGLSRVRLAREAISLAQQTERAAARLFRTGVMAGGALEVPKVLSDQAYKRLQDSLRENHSGAENAGSWMIAEEGAQAKKFAGSAVESQQIENRNHQIEEVARSFGVPRPLLMMDDTSWGSGIEQLNIFFLQYGLQHWFTAWEEALARVLLTEDEYEEMHFKFNERALLRGTLKDQSEAFAKGMGSGGHAPWYTQNEVRDWQDLPRVEDPTADKLPPRSNQKETKNEPAQTA